MSHPATNIDIVRIWWEQGPELYGFFAPFRPLHAFAPIDGRGARLIVSVRPGVGSRMPRIVGFHLDGEHVFIHLEVKEDYRPRERRTRSRYGFVPLSPEMYAFVGGHDLEDER